MTMNEVQNSGDLQGPSARVIQGTVAHPELDLPEERMYDKVRSRVAAAVRGKVPPRLQRAADLLLTLPDFVVLIFRLMKDPRVPARAKVKLALFAAYLASPVDLVPDFIPVLGFMDDLVGAVIVVRDLLSLSPKEVVLSHWSGNQDIIGLIETVLEVAPEVLGRNVLRSLLKRLGGAVGFETGVHSPHQGDIRQQRVQRRILRLRYPRLNVAVPARSAAGKGDPPEARDGH